AGDVQGRVDDDALHPARNDPDAGLVEGQAVGGHVVPVLLGDLGQLGLAQVDDLGEPVDRRAQLGGVVEAGGLAGLGDDVVGGVPVVGVGGLELADQLGRAGEPSDYATHLPTVDAVVVSDRRRQGRRAGERADLAGLRVRQQVPAVLVPGDVVLALGGG